VELLSTFATRRMHWKRNLFETQRSSSGSHMLFGPICMSS